MKANIHLVFNGKCDEAFTYYEGVFQAKRLLTMTYGQAPEGVPVPPGAASLVMHTALPLGSDTLMGCDAPPAEGASMCGFHVSIDSKDEAEVRRIFAALSDGGVTQMPLTPTFWSPLFGMCTDKFGVGWMISMPGPAMA